MVKMTPIYRGDADTRTTITVYKHWTFISCSFIWPHPKSNTYCRLTLVYKSASAPCELCECVTTLVSKGKQA